MSIVTSWFTAGRTLDVEPVQVFTRLQSALETKSKNALCAMVHIRLGIRNASIGKKSI